MPEGRWGRFLARLLPGDLAERVFVPAWWELLGEAARAEAERGRAPSAWGLRLRLLALYLDTLRVGATSALALGEITSWRTVGGSMTGGFRSLLRRPLFLLLASVTLAIGIGGNAAVYAVIEAVVLRPLPYEEPEELVILRHRDRRTGIEKDYVALGDFVDIDGRQRTLSSLAAFSPTGLTLREDGRSVHLSGLVATPDIFRVLRTEPLTGRPLELADALEGSSPVALISERVWRERFGSEPGTVGRTVTLDGTETAIVGILPDGFAFPPGNQTDVLVPMGLPPDVPQIRRSGWILTVGRLADGHTVETATTELGAISADIERHFPAENEGTTYGVEGLKDATLGDTGRAMWLLLAAVGLLFLVACVNVANLQLARALQRQKEMAVRVAVGAGRRHLLLQLLGESLTLSVVAAALGLVLAFLGLPAILRLVPDAATVAGLGESGIDGSVVAFAFILAVGATFGFGCASILLARPTALRSVLVTAGRSSASGVARSWSSRLVSAQIGLAVVLLLAAGAVLQNFADLLSVDPGFSYDDVAVLTVQLPEDRYAEIEAREGFYRRAFDRLEALPGVETAGAGVVVPLTGNNWTLSFERTDRPLAPGERAPDVGWQTASGGYFGALDIPLVDGRLFDERDGPGSPPVVVVSESIVEEYFPEGDAVGRRVNLGSTSAEIVGVVGDIRRAALSDAPRADLYLPFEAGYGGQVSFFLGGGSVTPDLEALRQTLLDLESEITFLDARTLAGIAADSIRVTELMLWLLGVFALAAFLLGAIGVYGVTAYSVRQRVPEIGTRMAMGADRRSILVMVLGQGLRIGLIGIGLGLLLSFLGLSLLRSQGLLEVTFDPLMVVAVGGLMAVTTVASTLVPARIASRIAPAETLKKGMG